MFDYFYTLGYGSCYAFNPNGTFNQTDYGAGTGLTLMLELNPNTTTVQSDGIVLSIQGNKTFFQET